MKVLGYRNQVFTGSFDDAVNAYQANPAENAAACTSYNYGSQNATAPDLCWVRKNNVKLGIGIDIEQFVTPGDRRVPAGDVLGREVRGGRIQLGGSLDGLRSGVQGHAVGPAVRRHGRRARAELGLAEHARYLALGGIDAFIGDGALRQATEGVFEIFYSFNLFKAIWLTGDFQLLWNPGYNADRGGPLVILGARAHAEF